MRWKVASDLRFRAAISEPRTPSFCGISGDLAPSTRKSLAIAIVRFWCAKVRSDFLRGFILRQATLNNCKWCPQACPDSRRRFFCGNDTVAVAMRFAMKNGRRPPDYSSNLCPPKTFVFDFFGGCFGPLSCCFSSIKGPKHPLKSHTANVSDGRRLDE